MTDARYGIPTVGQQLALDQLHQIREADPAALEVLKVGPTSRVGLRMEISLATAGAAGEGPGKAIGPRVRIRSRERFQIHVPPDFPYNYPHVYVVHDRFAGLPHVQWRHYLCLYISPTTEWQPSDGMFGFLDRLLLWVSRAAAGELDPAGEPLHPPIAYSSKGAGSVVVRADTPKVHDQCWTGFAVMRQVSPTRNDVVGWLNVVDATDLLDSSPSLPLGRFAGLDGEMLRVATAVLLSEPVAYEYPSKGRDLVAMLDVRGVDQDTLVAALALTTHINRHLAGQTGEREAAGETPVYVIVGTPMRGVAGGEQRQHLVAWRLPRLGQQAVELLDIMFSTVPDIAVLGKRARALVGDCLQFADLEWAHVYEDRPEVTTRRDRGSALEEVCGRAVLILGCGAIGGHVAENLTRAGVGRLVLVDTATVSPGVLVRQPYDDADIDRPKAEVLAERLRRIRPDLGIDVRITDALDLLRLQEVIFQGVDLIINATANPAVAAYIEYRRSRITAMAPLLSLVIGHTAQRGVVTLAPASYSGAGVDIFRKVKLETLRDERLRPFADDFFPEVPRVDHFQPEPGCSEATFIGSHAEVVALTSAMLLHALSESPLTIPSSAGIAFLVDLGPDRLRSVTQRLSWPTDIVRASGAGGLEVRLTPAALAEMRAECRLMARRREPSVETGGLLLGEIDDACRVMWVSGATGPPPDSYASPQLFICGTEGVNWLLDHYEGVTRGALRFMGMWHSHPESITEASDIDDEGMHELLSPVGRAPRRALLLIIGGAPPVWSSWLAQDQGGLPDLFSRLSDRSHPRETGAMATRHRTYAVTVGVGLNSGKTRRWPLENDKHTVGARQWFSRLLKGRLYRDS